MTIIRIKMRISDKNKDAHEHKRENLDPKLKLEAFELSKRDSNCNGTRENYCNGQGCILSVEN